MEKDKSKKFGGFLNGTIFGFLLCLALVFAYFYAPANNISAEEIPLESALELVRNAEIAEINFDERNLTLVGKDSRKFQTSVVSDAARANFLTAAGDTGTDVTFEGESKTLFALILLQFIPYATLFGTVILLIVIYNKLIKRKVDK